MFSALKKLASKNDGESNTPAGLCPMSRSLQSKFSKGVQYNMKLIIKGDRNVGKTCLFNRLQGRPFSETYVPTEEIQVTSIRWDYKVTDDVVKVEVWDVVDKGKKRVMSDNLKLGNADVKDIIQPALDAEFLNVYKGTHGVILMMDITKTWTFEYVQRELEKIPDTIPVLVLGNHCDMAHHRTTTADHVIFYLETLQRKAPARYTEGSMYNAFGLKFLHKWFNLPFLKLQRETLLAQLETNQKEIDITAEELDLYQQTDDSNYKLYLERLTNRRRQVAESNSSPSSSSIIIQTQHAFPSSITKEDLSSGSKSDTVSVTSTNSSINSSHKESITSSTSIKNLNVLTNSEKRSTAETPVPPNLIASIRNIDEFVPEDSLDKSFLVEDSNTAAGSNKASPNNDSDSEVDEGNPMVSGFQDDLDPEDSFPDAPHILKPTINEEPRGSPDGGDDQHKNTDSTLTSKNSKKKIEDKKKRSKKKSNHTCNDDLENFLNCEYEEL